MKGELNKNRGFVAIVVLTVATIVVLLFTFVYIKRDKTPLVNNTAPPQTPKDFVQVIDVSQIPGSLPKDLPVEKNVPLLKNEVVFYSAIGERHSVRSYYSTKDMGMIFSDFKNYFEKNKWKVVSSVDDPGSKYLLVMREPINGTIQLNISKSQIDGRVLVEVTKTDKSTPSIPK